MAFAVASTVEPADGLRRRVRLTVSGNAADLARVDRVRFDLGPTFTLRYRDALRSDTAFTATVEAYGSFFAKAELILNDESIQELGHEVEVRPISPTVQDHDSKSAAKTGRRSSPAPSWSGLALEFAVVLILSALGLLVVITWPDGTESIKFGLGFFDASIRVGSEARLVVLAALVGGFGAMLQVGVSLVTHLEVHTLSFAWLRWYLLRPLIGAVLGVAAYAVLRTVFVMPHAPATSISPLGLTALCMVCGYASTRATNVWHRFVERLFEPLLAEPAISLEKQTMTSKAQDADVSIEEQRRRDMEQADSILRGTDADAKAIYTLAERLKDRNEFGRARKLYGRIRRTGDYEGLDKTAARVGQRHALCTYKDPDLPAADRFERALEILGEVDQLKMSDTERQESLGLRGAVYKRRWQVQGQRADLVQARECYVAGHQIGAELDQGYTGINAAFVLDLLAREELDIELWRKAREIRTNLAELLPSLPLKPKSDWLRKEWWFHATRAEAYFGLGQFKEAVAALLQFNEELGLTHRGPPLEKLSPWELETTITQLASLVQLQADLTDRLSGQPGWKDPWSCSADGLRRQAAEALRSYLGEYAPGVERAFLGKVGLALSGGGFRASLFHLGVLACLAENDVLRHVEALSCVSGGSIVGAHYYLEVRRLLESKADNTITREDYIELVQRLERDFLSGVQTNIRSRTFGSVWVNLRTMLQPSYTSTRRLGELYEAQLYSLVKDGLGDQPRYLHQLLVKPLGEQAFKPKYDNWRRAAKVPILVLNATTLNTGHNWQFTASWMGEPPSRLDSEIGGNYRLRRMYHWEAPRLQDKWASWYRQFFKPPDYRNFRLGDAVAASSCVPGLFEPLVLPDLYEGKTVRLVDGGVYDNQGTASLLEQDCTVLIVSDASGQMDAQDMPSGSRLGVPLRSFSLSMARVRQTQFQELDARRRSGLLKGLVFLHLRKDLDAQPVDWRECQDPHEASDEAQPAARRGVLTTYGLQKSAQRLLSAIRTDLDSFTEVEAFALMTSGYRQALAGLQQIPVLGAVRRSDTKWRFLEIESLLRPGPGFDDLTRQLSVGRLSAGKVWLLWPPLTILGIALLLLSLFGLYRVWEAYQGQALLTVRALGIALLILGIGVALPHLVRIIRYGQTFRDLWLRSLVAAIVAVGFKIHLLLFDQLFLRLGRVSRLLSKRSRSTSQELRVQ